MTRKPGGYRMQSETATLRDGLRRLADNLRWTFRPSVAALFARVGGDRWQAVGHDPRALLASLDDETLEASDLHDDVATAVADLDAYLADANTWSSTNAPELTAARPVLYLSMEVRAARVLADLLGRPRRARW